MAADHSYAVAATVEEHAAPQAHWLPARPRRKPFAQRLLQGHAWSVVRMLVDSLLVCLAVGTTLLRTPTGAPDAEPYVVLVAPVTMVVLALGGHYRNRLQISIFDGLGRAIGAPTLAAVSLITAVALGAPHLDPNWLIVEAWAFACLYLVTARVVTNRLQRRVRASGVVAAPALIVGAGQIGAHVERRLTNEPELGLLPVGYIDSDPPAADDVPLRTAPVLGGTGELGRIVDQTGATHVVFGFTREPDSELFTLMRQCEQRGLQVSVVPRMFEFVNVRNELDHIGGLPLHSFEHTDPKSRQFALKHAFDRVVSAAALIVLGPLLLAVAIGVKLSSPGPALFAQRRIGRDGRDFALLKFRSMRMVDDPPTVKTAALLPADTAPGGVEGLDRRTRLGKFLRKTSLDELPQLINVVRGDMSLVGPRPERPEFVEQFEREIRRYDDRHRVKSGITGWAQVHGLRGRTSLSDRVEFDNHYISNWSLSLDLKILLLTVGAVLQRGGGE
jgi:exopolysaccharide biosynthesis polyprenyl glycosylphosphotransferase